MKQVLMQLNRMSNWQKNWDSCDADAPCKLAIQKSQKVMLNLYYALDETGQQWQPPSISADSFGEVVFKWWSKPKGYNSF